MKHVPLLCGVALAAFTSCSHKMQKIEYPVAPTSETVDTYFGVEVPDPYRPLENDTAAETLAWVEQERKITNDYLASLPNRDKIKNRLTQLANYPKHGMPSKKKDGRYYFYENDGLKNQSVLYRTDSLDSTPVVFLDPNALSEDGTVALTGTSMSPDGKYMAYTISRSGSDWTEIYVMDVETGQLLDDHIEWAKFTGADWADDGFYYSAYPRPEAGKEFSNANEGHTVYYHKLGTPQSADQIAYAEPENPLYFFSSDVEGDGQYLFITGSGQGLGNSLKVKDRRKPSSQWVTIEPSQNYEIGVVGVKNGKFYILTNYGAPCYRLMVAEASNPSIENWQELIPEGDGVLTSVSFTGSDKMIVTRQKDASDHPSLYNIDGTKIRDIELPTLGSVGFSTSEDNDDVFYSFTSFLYPAAIFSYDTATGESKEYKTTDIKGFNPEDYVTEQVFFPSVDGTQIPMFLTYKKGLKRDGKNPVFLYGYGGFNISLTPGFSAYRLFWLENGGIYAQVNMRGGGEYGEEWHLAGTKMNKQNVFDDFISAAEYLIKEKWTTPDEIVCVGGSNGGLLIGAVVNQRPDLFAVAIPQVGVMDMLRYHLFTIGWNWASDYGTSADSKEMFEYLYDYSPVHNIKNDGTPYPAIMVTTADHDDRVVPAHSFKYATTLQASDTGDKPKIIRIDSKAGHGGGKPVAKVIEEQTDIYSFILNNLPEK
ncbi:MAG: S9 family peptidase [Muribaculaceae bacterium]|nr:S9 family peptidase [Muribaculaceae bacterium]